MNLTRRASILCLLLPLAAAAASAGESGGWLGVMLGGDTPGAAEPSAAGVRVRLVAEDSPAADAGLRASDRILSVNGTAVATTADLLAQIRGLSPGDWVPVVISRKGNERELRVTLGERPQNLRELRLRRGWLGARAIDLPPALREHFGAPEDAGAMISDIRAAGPSEAAGLNLGDVVFEMDGTPVRSGADLVRKVSQAGVGNTVELRLMRNGSEIVVELVVDTAPENLDDSRNKRE